MTLKQKNILRGICMTLLCIGAVYFLFIVASFISVLCAMSDETAYWTQWQKEHIAALESSYASGEAPKVDESVFCGFDLEQATADGVSLADLRFLATHNSYKQGTTKQTDIFYNYALPVMLGKKYDYVFDTLTEQFNHGIRSIEIDLGKVESDDGFSVNVYHNALTETGSSMIDFELGLHEMKMWSDYNPGHLPVTVLVELKGGSFGKYADFDEEAMLYVDETLREVFGESLYTPAEALEGHSSFAELRESGDLPTLEEARGKFIFLLHETSVTDTYVGIDPEMRSQAMFLALTVKREKYRSPEWLDNALYVIINNAAEKSYGKMIEDALSENFIVRTRLDEFALISDKRFDAAMKSGAQILSTDYPPATEDRYGYTADIGGGKTVLLRTR